MTSSDKPIVWVVDEVDEELKTTVSKLRRSFKNYEIEIAELRPKPQKEDYLGIVSNTRTVALILDQRLATRGGINYTGIDLALFLRNVAPNLPIYILTAFAPKPDEPDDEFSGDAWSVEDILSKDILANKLKLRTFVDRFIRRINVYQSITEDREKRFEELLLRSLDGELSPDESQEFEKISFERLGALALSDQIQQSKLQADLNRLESLINMFKENFDDDQSED